MYELNSYDYELVHCMSGEIYGEIPLLKQNNLGQEIIYDLATLINAQALTW